MSTKTVIIVEISARFPFLLCVHKSFDDQSKMSNRQLSQNQAGATKLYIHMLNCTKFQTGWKRQRA